MHLIYSDRAKKGDEEVLPSAEAVRLDMSYLTTCGVEWDRKSKGKGEGRLLNVTSSIADFLHQP